jgi:hypothetical protein
MRLVVAPAAPDSDSLWFFQGYEARISMLLALVLVATFVVWFARRQAYANRTGGERARGRPDWADPKWRARVKALEDAEPTAIAKAGAGAVRVHATIASSPQSLGGASGRECVWRNNAGAGPDTAIASALVFVADASGRCAIESLEHARVIAPIERPERVSKVRATSTRPEHVALYIGDEVEIFGRFAPERTGDDPDPTKLVYGTLGADGPLEIRLRTRPTAIASTADESAAKGTPAADANDQGVPP